MFTTTPAIQPIAPATRFAGLFNHKPQPVTGIVGPETRPDLDAEAPGKMPKVDLHFAYPQEQLKLQQRWPNLVIKPELPDLQRTDHTDTFELTAFGDIPEIALPLPADINVNPGDQITLTLPDREITYRLDLMA